MKLQLLEFNSNISMYGFWFKEYKYNHCVNELILIFKSKSQIAVWKMNLLTEHYPVYGNNTYLNAEKSKKAQNSRLGLCARLLD